MVVSAGVARAEDSRVDYRTNGRFLGQELDGAAFCQNDELRSGRGVQSRGSSKWNGDVPDVEASIGTSFPKSPSGDFM